MGRLGGVVVLLLGGCYLSHDGFLTPEDDARADARRDADADVGTDDHGGPDADGDSDADADDGTETADDSGPLPACSTVAADLAVPGDFSTVQEAIDAAVDGQAICVEPGVHRGSIDFLGKRIRVFGVAGPAATILEPDGPGRVVSFASRETAETILEGLTVRGGHGVGSGGGILASNSSPTLRDLIVRDNRAESGGGGVDLSISLPIRSPTLIRVQIIGNEAGSYGGGLAADRGSPTLTDVLVAENRTGSTGGGIWFARDTTPTLLRVWVIDNESGDSGGGIQADAATGWMSNCVVAGNRALNEGGGIKIVGAPWTLDHVRITGNEGGTGGGLLLYNDADGTRLTNVVLAGNRGAGGAGLRIATCDAILENVAIVGNVNEWDAGGGIGVGEFSAYGRLTMTNVVVAGNRAVGGGAIAYDTDHPPEPTISHCAFGDNGIRPFDEVDNPTGADGNFVADPLFLNVSEADPASWDLHVAPASPLVHAGTPELADPDGAQSSIGAYGGPGGGTWDLDGDGSFEWWQAGGYDPGTYPAAGWDCDDRDAALRPGAGC